MGVEVGKQCRRIGVHINYAPVVDVNINPNDTMIKLITIIIERMSFLTSIENTIIYF